MSCWKMTTRPPLSPVARSSPEWLNSTVEMMSAANTNTNTHTQVLPLLGSIAADSREDACLILECGEWVNLFLKVYTEDHPHPP